nr:glycoside hydrolase family 32 protein [uncultured Gemmiger sp.]
MPTKLEEAREYEAREGKAIPEGDRPLFHLTPWTGWMNDPNGFCYYQGAYHLFYQYYPYDTVWGPMHWGHAVSTDLLHWEHRPCALAPDTPADAKGCFSGTAVPAPDGRLLLLYTGVQEDGQGGVKQLQCLASGDGTDFVKDAANPVIGETQLPPGGSAVDFRDPKIWYEDGRYLCVVSTRDTADQGRILLYESPDARRWSYRTTLDTCRWEYGKMWECPDFFALDGRQLLLVSPQEMQASPDGEFHPGFGTVALLGRYDKENARFTREAVQPIDYGTDFYAPQTVLTPDGRRVMVAWMENWATVGEAPRRHKWFGRMSLPRELFIRDGRLCQRPVRELEGLWQNTLHRQETLDGDAVYEGISGRRLDLTVTLDVAASPDCRRFTLRLAENARFHTRVEWNPVYNELVFDRSGCGSRRDIPHIRRLKAAPRNGRLTLRLVLDGDCVELFVNDGERALTALLDTPAEADGISLHSEGPAVLDLQYHKLG